MLETLVPNVATILSDRARSHPASIALVDADTCKEWSFGSLHKAASKVAENLSVAHVAGDRIALCMDNGPEFVISWFGALYAGLTTLPLSPKSTSDEITFVVDHASCKSVITDQTHRKSVEEAVERVTANVATVLLDTESISVGGSMTPVDLPQDTAAMLLYTSGTTGAAKGAAISHESLLQHTKALVTNALDLTERDRVLGVLPLTHSYGIRMTLLAPFAAGALTIFVPKFDAAKTLKLIDEHNITWIAAVPTMLVRWGHQPPKAPDNSLRWCLSAGAPLPIAVQERAERVLGAEVRQGYGLTEATFCTINAPPDERISLCVGKPVGDVQIRIVDENDNELPHDQRGEVLVRGVNMMSGYLGDPMATRHVMANGWLHTGDIGTLDADGRLFIVDRIKDMILVGGRNVYPAEVENVAAQHPHIKEACVVGRPHREYGEEVVLVVVEQLGETLDRGELDSWLRKRLSNYKVPRHLATVDRLPQGKSGKILKRKVRDAIRSGDLSTQELGT